MADRQRETLTPTLSCGSRCHFEVAAKDFTHSLPQFGIAGLNCPGTQIRGNSLEHRNDAGVEVLPRITFDDGERLGQMVSATE